MGVEDDHEGDPFAGWTLDDAFVAAAAVPEASAEERARRPEPRSPLGPSGRGRGRRRRRARPASSPARRGVTAAILVLVAVIAAALARDALARSGDPSVVAPEDQRVLVDGEEMAFPTPAPSADAPLGTPPDVPVDTAGEPASGPTSNGFVPANVQADGALVTWDPCRPIRYVVGPGVPPEGAEGLLDEAIAEVEAATGLTFVSEGTTDEPADEARAPIQPERYGDRWAPVLVAWTDPGQVPALAGPVAGQAGPTAFARPGGLLAYTTATVYLDGPELADVLDEEGRDPVRGVVMHELAHLVGLDHVDDPTELMYPESQEGITTFGPGDRSGLARLGAGPCIPDL